MISLINYPLFLNRKRTENNFLVKKDNSMAPNYLKLKNSQYEQYEQYESSYCTSINLKTTI